MFGFFVLKIQNENEEIELKINLFSFVKLAKAVDYMGDGQYQ